MKKLLLLSIIASALTASSAAEIKVGAIAGPEKELVEVAQKVAKEKYDLDVVIVEFSDYVMPNLALDDGEIDANAFQHKPYLDGMIRDKGLNLELAGLTFVYPIGGYSQKIKSIDELKEGSVIAIPNDPTNGGRSLLLLEKIGLIKLKDSTNLESSVLDIVENPKNLVIKEIEAPQLPRVLSEVDLAFINSTFAVPADLLPERDAIVLEDSDSPYTNLIAVRAGTKDKEEIVNFVKSYQSEEVEQKAKELFKGAAVRGWK